MIKDKAFIVFWYFRQLLCLLIFAFIVLLAMKLACYAFNYSFDWKTGVLVSWIAVTFPKPAIIKKNKRINDNERK